SRSTTPRPRRSAGTASAPCRSRPLEALESRPEFNAKTQGRRDAKRQREKATSELSSPFCALASSRLCVLFFFLGQHRAAARGLPAAHSRDARPSASASAALRGACAREPPAPRSALAGGPGRRSPGEGSPG